MSNSRSEVKFCVYEQIFPKQTNTLRDINAQKISHVLFLHTAWRSKHRQKPAGQDLRFIDDVFKSSKSNPKQAFCATSW